MAVISADLRNYLRLSPDSDEELVFYLNAAKAKAADAGVPNFQNNAEYDLFLLSLAGMYYENRSLAFAGSYQATAEENARRLINSFVLSLRYSKDEL